MDQNTKNGPDITTDNGGDSSDFDDNIEVTLPRYGEGWLLESYGEIIPANIEAQKRSQIERITKLQDMQLNPQRYFNFGFNIDDYIIFLLKHTMMRAERQVIEEEYRKYLEQKNFKFREDKQ